MSRNLNKLIETNLEGIKEKAQKNKFVDFVKWFAIRFNKPIDCQLGGF